MEHLKCSNKKAMGLLREFAGKGVRLIERRRQGLGRPCWRREIVTI